MVSAVGYFNHLLGWASRVAIAPVIIVAGIAVAAWGQYMLLSDQPSVLRAAMFMTVGGLAFLTGLLMEWRTLSTKAVLDQDTEGSEPAAFPWGLRQQLGLVVGILGGLAGFFLNDDNTFTTWGFSLWLVGCMALLLAFWPLPGQVRFRLPKLDRSSAWVLVVLGFTLGLAAFFRFFELDNVLKEMWADHVDLLESTKLARDGRNLVYFPAGHGQGQEPLHFYLAAGLSFFFGYSFLTLKVLTAIAGVLTVAATYFMTKELFGNQRIALFAAILMSFSFWHILVSRAGFPAYSLMSLTVALTMLFLFRALKYNRSSDFVFAGLFLGLVLYTYQGARVVPLAVGLILIISLSSRLWGRRSEWPTFFLNSALLTLTALVVYAPLGRYALDFPERYWRRVDRVSILQADGPIWETLGDNIKQTLLVFNWQDAALGNPRLLHALQLDYLTSAAFVLGLGAMALLWLRRRRGLNVYAVLALLVMLIPLIGLASPELSAFRAAGAIPLVFAAAALPFYIGSELLAKAFGRWALVLILALLGVALGLIGSVNHDIYFEYTDYWSFNSRNTREFGTVFRQFAERGGDLDNAYLKNRPGYINSSVLAVWAGDLDWRNVGFSIEDAREHALNPEAKLYVVPPDDGPTVLGLMEIYPQGSAYRFESSRTDKGRLGFFVFLVPAEGEAPMAPLPNTNLVR